MTEETIKEHLSKLKSGKGIVTIDDCIRAIDKQDKIIAMLEKGEVRILPGQTICWNGKIDLTNNEDMPIYTTDGIITYNKPEETIEMLLAEPCNFIEYRKENPSVTSVSLGLACHCIRHASNYDRLLAKAASIRGEDD